MGFKEDLIIVLEFEGGYVNDPVDPGGATNKGVTQKTYDNYRRKRGLPVRDVREILFNEVEEIYYSYYTGASCDRIEKSHPLTATVHFDFAINAGIVQANKTLQRACGARPIDGKLGRISFNSISKVPDRQLYKAYVEERIKFYNNLVKRRPALNKFLRGWLRRTEHLRKILDDRANNSKESVSGSSTSAGKCPHCGSKQ